MSQYIKYPTPASGGGGISPTPSSSATNVIQPTGPTIVPLTLRGAVSQSADLLEFQDSSSNISMFINIAYPSNYWGGNEPSILINSALYNDGATALVLGSSDISSAVSLYTTPVSIITGDNTADSSIGNTGSVTITTGRLTGVAAGGDTGAVVTTSGSISDSGSSGASGSFFASSGSNAGSGKSGDVKLFSGAAVGNSGTAQLTTGNSSGGNSGDIIVKTGTASGTRGVVRVQPEVRIEGTTSGYVGIKSVAAPTSYTVVLPSAQGSAGNLLQNDGSGNLSWSGFTGCRYHNATATVTASPSLLSFTTADYDDGSGYSAGIYTVQVGRDGKYNILAQALVVGTYIVGSFVELAIYINNALYSREEQLVGNAAINFLCFDINDYASLVAGDTVEIRVSSDGTTPTINNSDSLNYLNIVRVAGS